MSEHFNEFGPFAVGEICRVVYSKYCPELVGAEVRITSRPHWIHNQFTGESWVGYETDIAGFAPPEAYLRRRKPPADSSERMFMQSIRDMADKAPQRQGVPA